VSGELTLGEDIADSGGVKMAHRAWQQANILKSAVFCTNTVSCVFIV
jgi:predicted metalloendopeptidase